MSSVGKGRGRYLGFVAHEIKNPLATALWSCDLLRRMEATDRAGPRADKMIDASLRALRRMRRLIDDYFTIERLLEAGYELRREPTGVHDLVTGTFAQMTEKDGFNVEGWTVEAPADLSIQCDHEMIRRGLRVLLEYMAGAKDAKLSVAAVPGTEDGFVGILIRSTQPPAAIIPPEPEDRPSGDPLGMVLGFALGRTVVAAHGGRLAERESGLFIELPSR